MKSNLWRIWYSRRRLVRTLTLVWTIVHASTAIASDTDQMPWVPDLATARQIAQHHNQLVLVHFTSDSCPPCRRLEKNVFTQAAFADAIRRVAVPVRINVTLQPQYAADFNVNSWPTDVLLAPDGRELHRMTSPQDHQEYLRAVQQVAWHFHQGTSSSMLVGYSSDRPVVPSVQDNMHAHAASTSPPSQPVPASAETSIYGSGSNASMPSVYGNDHAYRQTAPPTSGQAIAPHTANNAGASMYGGGPQYVQNPYLPYGSPVTPSSEGQSQPMAVRPTVDTAQVASSMPTPVSATVGSQFAASTNTSGSIPAEAPPYGAPPVPGPSSPPAYAQMSFQSQTSIPSATPSGVPDMTVSQNSQVPSVTAAERVPAAPTTTPTVGMDGFCPVTVMDENQWVQGDRQWGAQHRGRIYLFRSAEAQRKFLADPERYAPALAGFDPVCMLEQGQYATGKREHGVRYNNRMYLFGNEESLQRFAQAPDYYVGRIDQVLKSTTTR